jgi:peptidoglycan/LPS O-acetylase OafA/YrhL
MPESFKINNFDFIRIIAATQVMIFHTVKRLELGSYWWVQALDCFPGVPIFFVTSGFLISASLERTTSLREFAIKRCLRIYPALWCCLIATVATIFIFGFDVLTREASIWFSLQTAGVIYTPQFLKTFGMGSYNGSLWTIPIELQFYFMLPVFYFLLKSESLTRRLWLIFAIFLAISISIKIALPNMGVLELESLFEKLLRASFLPHIYLFLFGVVMQRSKLYASRWIKGKALYWLLAYAVLASQKSTLIGSFCEMLMLGILTLSVAYTLPGMAERLFHGNDISYGTYIYHGLVINIFIQLGIVGKLTSLPLVMAITFFIAYCSWRFIEKPLISRKSLVAALANGSTRVPI